MSTHDKLEAVMNNTEVFLTYARLDFGSAWIRMVRECCIKIFWHSGRNWCPGKYSCLFISSFCSLLFNTL